VILHSYVKLPEGMGVLSDFPTNPMTGLPGFCLLGPGR
jgi:hypothetical protein